MSTAPENQFCSLSNLSKGNEKRNNPKRCVWHAELGMEMKVNHRTNQNPFFFFFVNKHIRIDKNSNKEVGTKVEQLKVAKVHQEYTKGAKRKKKG